MNPRPPDWRSGALPSELQVHFVFRGRFSPRCPEGIEPSASGVEVRRSCPAELQARLHSSSIIICAAAGAPRGRKTHGTGSRVRLAGRSVPRRVPTRTALFLDPDPSCQKRCFPATERRPASPVVSGRQGALLPAPAPARAAKALRRSTSHGVPEIPTADPRTAPRIHPTHVRLSPPAESGRLRTRQRHASHVLRGRLGARVGRVGVDVHRRGAGRLRVWPRRAENKKEPRSSGLLAKT